MSYQDREGKNQVNSLNSYIVIYSRESDVAFFVYRKQKNGVRSIRLPSRNHEIPIVA